MKTLLFLIMLMATAFSQAQNLLVYYTFQNCTPSDLSGNGNHGTLVGGAYVTCSGNSRILRAGKTETDYMSIPPNVLDGLNDFSIHFKVRFNHFYVKGTDPMNTVISASNPGCINCFGIAYDKNNLVWRVYLNGLEHTFADSTVMEDQVRNCMSLFRENGTITLTRNDVILGTAFDATTLSITNFIIGQQEDCLGGCFEKNQALEGGIDNFKVYDGIKDPLCGENVFAEKWEEEEPPLRTGDRIIIYPNPVSSFASISFFLEQDSQVTIELFDLAGRKVQSLVNQRLLSGSHDLQFFCEQLPAGIYFLKSGINGKNMTTKVVIAQY